jgi:ethanolamine ammonia-lyase small subunit
MNEPTAPGAPVDADSAANPGLVGAATPAPDPWAALRAHTPARIALGRTGASLPTAEVLRFAAAHAQARDAVHQPLDTAALAIELHAEGWAVHPVASAAADRATYLRRPDLGRRLGPASAKSLHALQALALPPPDLALVLADGLCATAAQQHGAALLGHLRRALAGAVSLSPVFLATQARVALGDEVGELLQARAVLVLLGERPGLSSPDSLGAYLTFAPRLGRHDAERNCVSNIRPAGLAPVLAAARLAWLVHEALRLRLTGVALKDDSATPLLSAGADMRAERSPPQHPSA